MHDKFLVLFVFIGTLVSAYGWGKTFLCVCRLPSSLNRTLTACLGLSCWVIFGGVFNLAHLAVPFTVYFVQFSGILLALYFLSSFIRTRRMSGYHPPCQTAWDCVPYVVLIIAVGYLFATLLPTMAFNFDDDFRVYLVRPLRMLQTGTLAGNPFDPLGFDSLGGQAFLQAMFLAWLPVSYITLFDPVLCLFLLALLIDGLGRQLAIHGGYRTLAIVLLFVVNPLSVNVSSLFSGSLIIIALIYASFIALRSNSLRTLILPAVLMGTLLSLKNTYFAFAGMYGLLFMGLYCFTSEPARPWFRSIVLFLSVLLLALLPWAILCHDSLPVLLQKIMGLLTTHSSDSSLPKHSYGYEGFYGRTKAFHGNSMFDYLYVAGAIGVAGILLIFRIRQPNNPYAAIQHLFVMVCGIAVISYIIALNVILPEVGIRYILPILIPVLILTCLIAPSSGNRLSRYFMLLVYVGVIVIFSQNLAIRIKQLYETHNLLPFSRFQNNTYMTYNKFSLGSESWKATHALQRKTKKGEGILVVAPRPFQFDFSRNPVFNVHNSMLAVQHFPLNGTAEDIRDYLNSFGVRYVFWAYGGMFMPKEEDLKKQLHSPRAKDAKYALQFMEALKRVARISKPIVYIKDAQTMLFDLNDRDTINPALDNLPFKLET